jgi:hypothetical protein
MFSGGKQPSFYLPNQHLSRLSKKNNHSPTGSDKQDNTNSELNVKTLYLPKIKDMTKASSHGFEE